MGASWRVTVLAILALVTALPLVACGGSNHAVSEIDHNVPVELIVARDTDDDDKGELFVDAGGSEQVKLSPDGVLGNSPAWSPDGSWIAFTAYDINDGSPELHVMRPDGTDHRAINLSKGANQLSWSPGGQWIAFTTVNAESDGPITSIHLSVINPFDEQPEAHTLVRDLVDQGAPAWRASP